MTGTRTAQRLSRILAMVPWVIAHPGATVEEVCKRFDYSRAELVRDLNLVFVCGLPGYGPGDLMEAYIDGDEVIVDMADYFASPLRLTPAETLMLLAAGMALVSSGTAPEALESAVDKLQKVLMPEGTLAVELPAEPEYVSQLSGHAARGEVVEISYTSIAKGETTTREVEPWSVHSSMGNWYLRGFCRLAGDERLFRIDRIRRLRPTGGSFTPAAREARTGIRYSPGVDDVTAVIRLSPAASWVSEYYPVEIVSEDDGAQVVRFSAADPSVAARLFLRLGGTAALLEGDEVAEALGDLRSRILRRYGAAG